MRIEFLIFILLSVVGSMTSLLYYILNYHFSKKNEEHQPLNHYGKEDITCIVTVYNEDPLRIRESLRIIIPQVYKTIVVVDGNPEIYRNALNGMNVEIIGKKARSGKRDSMGLGMESVETPFVVFMDGDVIPSDDAVGQLLKNVRPDTGGIGGNLHFDTSDGKPTGYAMEFFERAKEKIQKAMNYFGSVMLIDGPFCMYRSDLIKDHVVSEEFRTKKYRGKIIYQGGGDDAELTSYVIRKGYYAKKCFSCNVTVEPKANFKSLWKQMERWTRTTWRNFFENIRNGTMKKANRFYKIESFFTFVIPILLFGSLLFRGVVTAELVYRFGLINLIIHTFSMKLFYRGSYFMIFRSFYYISSLSSVVFGLSIINFNVKRNIKLLAWGSLGSLILFLSSIYTLFTLKKA
ncbi:glycosyltransferase [Caldiplasma sukawensis]